MTKITQKKFIEACKNSMGNQQIIAKRLCVTDRALRKYLKNHLEMREYLEEVRDTIVTTAEIETIRKVKEGYWPAINKVLSTLGSKSGWTEKVAVEHSGKLDLRETELMDIYNEEYDEEGAS